MALKANQKERKKKKCKKKPSSRFVDNNGKINQGKVFKIRNKTD